MNKKFLLVFVAFSVMLYAKEVTVSILPQKYFLEKIAGDKFDVNVMVKPGSSPATYEPKISQMKKLAKSEAYFSIGVPFEKVWLEKFHTANKNIIIVDTSKEIEKLEMQVHEHNDEDKKEEHEKHYEGHEEKRYEYSGLDPHIWLDPILVKIQAKNILKALIKIDEKNSSFYKQNYESFLKELDLVDSKIKNILKLSKNRAFIVFHPSWGYFAKRYDLKQIAIEIEGKEPKTAQLVEFIKEAKRHNIKIVFVSSQFSQKSAKTIAKSINGKVAVIDPLSLKWDDNLIKIAKDITNIYK